MKLSKLNNILIIFLGIFSFFISLFYSDINTQPKDFSVSYSSTSYVINTEYPSQKDLIVCTSLEATTGQTGRLFGSTGPTSGSLIRVGADIVDFKNTSVKSAGFCFPVSGGDFWKVSVDETVGAPVSSIKVFELETDSNNIWTASGYQPNTQYTASSDMDVCAYSTAGTDGIKGRLYGKTGETTLMTVVSDHVNRKTPARIESAGFCFPVKKGHLWQVDLNETAGNSVADIKTLSTPDRSYGSWTDYTHNTLNTAETDMRVCARLSGSTGNQASIVGYSGQEGALSKIVSDHMDRLVKGKEIEEAGFCFPVKKAEKWKVELTGGSGSVSVKALSFNSSTSGGGGDSNNATGDFCNNSILPLTDTTFWTKNDGTDYISFEKIASLNTSCTSKRCLGCIDDTAGKSIWTCTPSTVDRENYCSNFEASKDPDYSDNIANIKQVYKDITSSVESPINLLETELGFLCGPVDVNFSSKVDFVDFTEFTKVYRYFQEKSSLLCSNTFVSEFKCGSKDYDSDGKVNFKDFVHFGRIYLKDNCNL